MTIRGGCHCGAIAFEADGTPDEALECNCSHCFRKGFLLWFRTPETFRLTAGEEGAMTAYQFNKRHITHLFCPTCGVQPFARGTTREGAPTFAVNLRCVEGFERDSVKVVPVDGRSY